MSTYNVDLEPASFGVDPAGCRKLGLRYDVDFGAGGDQGQILTPDAKSFGTDPANLGKVGSCSSVPGQRGEYMTGDRRYPSRRPGCHLWRAEQTGVERTSLVGHFLPMASSLMSAAGPDVDRRDPSRRCEKGLASIEEIA